MDDFCDQFVPSHSQVSLPPVVPPNSTVTPRAASYAIACESRGDGAEAGILCDQFVPSHSHVSPLRLPAVPPKSTVTRRTLS